MEKKCSKCEIMMEAIRAQGDWYWICRRCNRVDCCPDPETNQHTAV